MKRTSSSFLRTLLLIAVPLGASVWGACGRSGDLAEAPRVQLTSPETKALLGEDDGFDAAIFYGAELMGSIDGCGCFGSVQAGGVPYRFGYTEGFRAAYPEAALLQVDAGYAMGSIRDSQGSLLPDLETKNDAVLGAFDRLGYDAINLTAHDLDYMARYFGDGRGRLVAERPVLGRFVSANVVPAGEGLVAPPAYLVRELAGERVPGGRLRVAFTGVTEDAPEAARSGFRIADPDAALASTIPAARAESDLVVVLVFMEPERFRRIAGKYAEQVDLFIVAHPNAREDEPSLGAPPRMAFARYKTTQLGELRLHLDGRKLARATNRYVKLDEPLPRDPIAAQLAAEAKEAFKAAQMRRFEERSQ